MSEIINLKRARKAKARAEKDVVAEANRAKHGIKKSAHQKAKAVAEKESRRLEGHKLEEE